MDSLYLININMRCIEIATFLPLLLLLLKCIEDDFDYTIKKYRTAVSKKMPRPEIIWINSHQLKDWWLSLNYIIKVYFRINVNGINS